MIKKLTFQGGQVKEKNNTLMLELRHQNNQKAGRKNTLT